MNHTSRRVVASEIGFSFLGLRPRANLLLIPITAALLLLSDAPVNTVFANPSDLDATFGGSGKVTTDFFGFYDACSDVAIQKDGKIVVGGGASRDTIRIDFALARYNQDGSLDNSFGAGGKVNTTFPFSAGISGISKIAIQPDGKIIAVGSTYGTLFYDFALARYNSDGSLDSNFGSGGLVVTDFFGEYDSINSLVLQADGKIVVGGTVSKMDSFFQNLGDFGIARYNVDGTLDSSFGTGGKVIGDFTIARFLSGISLQPNGRLLIVEGAFINNQNSILFSRFDTDGTIDATFGVNGTISHPSINGVILGVGAFASQPNGQIIIGGPSASGSFGYYRFTLARINPDGTQDEGFGSGGLAIADFGSNSQIHSISIQNNGKIVTAGEVIVNQVSLDFGLSRFNSNGTPDLSFGIDGKLTVDFFADFDFALGTAIQKDGKIIAVGFSRRVNTGNDFALVRLKGDTVYDICIQDDSNRSTFRFNSTTGDYQFTNCTGFTLSGIGVLIKRGSTITLQNFSSDRRVLATIDSSVNRGTAYIQLLSGGTFFTITDRNVGNNTCACLFP